MSDYPNLDDCADKFNFPVQGRCKLLSQDCPPALLEDCHKAAALRAAAIDGARVALLEDELAKVRREVLHFRDNPGCNPARRKLALRRLLWAVGEEYP